MNKFEYWFLDTAIEEVIGFSWIVPDEQYGCIAINRDPLELTVDEIANIFYKLFQKGYLLAASSEDFDNSGQIKGGFMPSLLEITAALREEVNLGYYLTAQGGNQWETVSNPQWEQYFSWPLGIEPVNEGEIVCGSREVGENLISMIHLLSPGNSRLEVIPGTVMWETLTPWEATYWKTLPIGYRIRYQFTYSDVEEYSTFEEDEGWVEWIKNEDGRDERQPIEFVRQRQQAQEWYRNTKRWYTNYYFQ
ncbi:hypothetical protein [Pseudanabaena sp. PCC 6802]|uniref:hypothetical protein n=1 Tax=Pseudanabaena sp. PCC 6802 TaxID=118173 RepID=UPI00037899B6|nr:hypothetical protein [Pseudanabaena sp. PCC 6802]